MTRVPCTSSCTTPGMAQSMRRPVLGHACTMTSLRCPTSATSRLRQRCRAEVVVAGVQLLLLIEKVRARRKENVAAPRDFLRWDQSARARTTGVVIRGSSSSSDAPELRLASAWGEPNAKAGVPPILAAKIPLRTVELVTVFFDRKTRPRGRFRRLHANGRVAESTISGLTPETTGGVRNAAGILPPPARICMCMCGYTPPRHFQSVDRADTASNNRTHRYRVPRVELYSSTDRAIQGVCSQAAHDIFLIRRTRRSGRPHAHLQSSRLCPARLCFRRGPVLRGGGWKGALVEQRNDALLREE